MLLLLLTLGEITTIARPRREGGAEEKGDAALRCTYEDKAKLGLSIWPLEAYAVLQMHC